MTCTICLEILGDKNKIILNCGHEFHCQCLFLLFSYNDKKCPNCREPVLYVPESDLQNRLNIMEEEKNKLKTDAEILFGEYENLNKFLIKQEAIYLLDLTRKEIELNNKEDYNIKLFTSNQKLKTELASLRSKIRDLERNNHSYQITTKNNQIMRLKNELQKEKYRNDRLSRNLDKVTTENIEYANTVDRTLETVKYELSKMGNSEISRAISRSRRRSEFRY